MSNKEVIVTDSISVSDSIKLAITNKHKSVSRIKTPKPFIKKKMG